MRYVLSLILLLAAGTPALAAATFEEAVALFEDKEFKSAREIAEPLAKDGDARAMAMMGALYQLGNGVKPDLGEGCFLVHQGSREKSSRRAVLPCHALP